VDLAVDPMNDVTFTLGGRRRTFYFTPQPLYQQFAGLTTPAYTAEPGLPGTLPTQRRRLRAGAAVLCRSVGTS